MDSNIKNEYVDSKLMYTTQQLAAQFTPWLPLMSTYKPTGAHGINWHSLPVISNENISLGTSEDQNIAKTQDFSPPNDAIKCYVCDQYVVQSEFALHLFFGELKCNDCHIKVLDCKSFRSDYFISSSCVHRNLCWSENPIDFLKSQLPEPSTSDYENVYCYVKDLKSLEELFPWKSVFQEYDRFNKLYSNSIVKYEPVDSDTYKYERKITNTNDSNSGEVLILEAYDLNQMEDAVQVVSLVDFFQDNDFDIKSEREIHETKLTNNVEIDTICIDNKNIATLSKNRDVNLQERESDYLNKIIPLEKKYVSEVFEKSQFVKHAVGYVLLKDKHKKKSEKGIRLKQKQVINVECNDKRTLNNVSNDEKIKRNRKKLKKNINIDQNIVEEHVEVSNSNFMKASPDKTLTMDSEIIFLDLPEDGYYLVIRTPIEECVMCYSKLNIKNCRVNIKLLLYTFWCQCGLKIIYVPKTPANIDHPVKIIEEKL